MNDWFWPSALMGTVYILAIAFSVNVVWGVAAFLVCSTGSYLLYRQKG